jgi:hypothetical protein
MREEMNAQRGFRQARLGPSRGQRLAGFLIVGLSCIMWAGGGLLLILGIAFLVDYYGGGIRFQRTSQQLLMLWGTVLGGLLIMYCAGLAINSGAIVAGKRRLPMGERPGAELCKRAARELIALLGILCLAAGVGVFVAVIFDGGESMGSAAIVWRGRPDR